MLRQATLMLVVAVALAPLAVAGQYSRAPQKPPQHVVVRTELVSERDGFDWLDAAAGFGLAIVSVLAVLLALHRPRVRWAHGTIEKEGVDS